MELLDLVDSKDRVIGKAERQKCHERFLAHRMIHVFVFDNQGRIFVAKRSPKKRIYPKLLDVSVAGHVHTKETYKQAAIREIQEELGVKPKKVKKLFKFRLKTKPENAFITQYSAILPKIGRLNKIEVESGKFIEYKKMKKIAKQMPKKFAPTSIAALKNYKK